MGQKGTGWGRSSQAWRGLAPPAQGGTASGAAVGDGSEELLAPCAVPSMSRAVAAGQAAGDVLAVGRGLGSHPEQDRPGMEPCHAQRKGKPRSWRGLGCAIVQCPLLHAPAGQGLFPPNLQHHFQANSIPTSVKLKKNPKLIQRNLFAQPQSIEGGTFSRVMEAIYH